MCKWFLGDLGGARTLGPLIKSQLLYQLSYEVKCCILPIAVCGCKYATLFFILQAISRLFFLDVVINIGYIFVFIQFIKDFINFSSLFRC